jgi:hypothetical protein
LGLWHQNAPNATRQACGSLPASTPYERRQTPVDYRLKAHTSQKPQPGANWSGKTFGHKEKRKTKKPDLLNFKSTKHNAPKKYPKAYLKKAAISKLEANPVILYSK